MASNIKVYLNASVPIALYYRHDNDVWVAGPSEDWMRRYRLDVRREGAEAIELGRLDAVELQVRCELDERVRNQREHLVDSRDYFGRDWVFAVDSRPSPV